MTLDDVVTMLIAEAIRARFAMPPREWPLDLWIDYYEGYVYACQRARRAGWVYR